MLMMVAATTVQMGRGSKGARLDYEARNIARSLLESYQARAVDLLTLGPQTPPVTGEMSNGASYTATVDLYSLGGGGIYFGLNNNDIKGIRVTVSWTDSNGSHQEQVEGNLIRIAR